MSKILKIVFSFCIVALSYASLQAADDVLPVGSSSPDNFYKVGAAGAQFLKIGIGARGTGMGGAQAALSNDLTSVFWNAAGVADVKTVSAAFNHTTWFAGYSHNFAAVAMPLNDQFVIALNAITFGSDNIPITTLSRPEGTGGTYNVSNLSFGATIAGYLTEQFSFGITAKMVQNAFSTVSAAGVAFDIGTRYDTGLEGLVLGFSIQNLGAQQQYSGQDLNVTKRLVEEFNIAPLDAQLVTYPFSLPLVFRAGLGLEIYNDEENIVNVAADFVTLSDTPEQYSFGGEYIWNDILSVRAGYVFGHDQLGLAGGIGLKYFTGSLSGRFDYSINPTINLGIINRINLTVDLGS